MMHVSPCMAIVLRRRLGSLPSAAGSSPTYVATLSALRSQPLPRVKLQSTSDDFRYSFLGRFWAFHGRFSPAFNHPWYAVPLMKLNQAFLSGCSSLYSEISLAHSAKNPRSHAVQSHISTSVGAEKCRRLRPAVRPTFLLGSRDRQRPSTRSK